MNADERGYWGYWLAFCQALGEEFEATQETVRKIKVRAAVLIKRFTEAVYLRLSAFICGFMNNPG